MGQQIGAVVHHQVCVVRTINATANDTCRRVMCDTDLVHKSMRDALSNGNISLLWLHGERYNVLAPQGKVRTQQHK